MRNQRQTDVLPLGTPVLYVPCSRWKLHGRASENRMRYPPRTLRSPPSPVTAVPAPRAGLARASSMGLNWKREPTWRRSYVGRAIHVNSGLHFTQLTESYGSCLGRLPKRMKSVAPRAFAMRSAADSAVVSHNWTYLEFLKPRAATSWGADREIPHTKLTDRGPRVVEKCCT